MVSGNCYAIPAPSGWGSNHIMFREVEIETCKTRLHETSCCSNRSNPRVSSAMWVCVCMCNWVASYWSWTEPISAFRLACAAAIGCLIGSLFSPFTSLLGSPCCSSVCGAKPPRSPHFPVSKSLHRWNRFCLVVFFSFDYADGPCEERERTGRGEK